MDALRGEGEVQAKRCADLQAKFEDEFKRHSADLEIITTLR